MAKHRKQFQYRRPIVPALLLAGCLVFSWGTMANGWLSSANAGDTAQLNRFEIKTDDNQAVKIILYTDGRAGYQTENTPQGFTVKLSDTKLSSSLTNSGMPVVTDNQNRFIARATSAGDNQVKIVIPNLPADQYSVSVIQRSESATVTKQATPPNMLAVTPVVRQHDATTTQEDGRRLSPRVAVNASDTDGFEAIAKNFAPENVVETTIQRQPRPSVTGRSPRQRWVEVRPQSTASAGYTVMRSAVSPAYNQAYLPQTPVHSNIIQMPSYGNDSVAVSPRAYFPEWNPNVSVLSTNASDMPPPPPLPRQYMGSMPASAYGGNALQMADNANLSGGQAPSLLATAWPQAMPKGYSNTQQLDPGMLTMVPEPSEPQMMLAAAAGQAAPVTAKPMTPFRQSLADLQDWLSHLPVWVYVVSGLLMTGVMVFTLAGGVILLRMLFVPLRQHPAAGVQGHYVPAYAPSYGIGQMSQMSNGVFTASSPVGDSETEDMFSAESIGVADFEDRARINANDYLMGTSDDVRQAVRQAVLIKFPDETARRSANGHPRSALKHRRASGEGVTRFATRPTTRF